MNIVLWIVFGAIAGWVASLITGSDRGVLGDIILGILGAVIGGWVVSLFGGNGVTGFNFPSLLVAILGSILVIWIARMVRRGSTEV